MIPVTPEQFRALIPTSQDDLCEQFRKILLWEIRFWQLSAYWFDSSGELSTDFVAEICAAHARQPNA